jgi:transcriptional regulator with XRE-family HTH domain
VKKLHRENSLGSAFAERLKTARGERSQAEFARFLGIKHQQTYQRYEAGQIPSGDVLHGIAIKLGVTMNELLGELPRSLPGFDKIVSRMPMESPQQILRELCESELVTVSDEDQEKGFVDFRVRYRWVGGSRHHPEKVRLTRPASREVQNLFVKLNTDGDRFPLIFACLPEELRAERFLDRLDACSLFSLELVCLELAFGARFVKIFEDRLLRDWQSKKPVKNEGK